MDPCSSDVYTEIDEPSRSTAFRVTSQSEHESDYLGLEEGWYRSVSGAGSDMPTTVVHTEQCNALAPVWINGMCDLLIICILLYCILLVLTRQDVHGR